MKKITKLILAIFTFSFSGMMAQTDTCAINMKNAGTAYEQGSYDNAIKLLKRVITYCDLGKDEKIAADKLLILSYLAVDNLEAANSTAAEIMKINPNYKPDKFKDDPKLSTIFDKYIPTPQITIGIFGGFNIPFIHVVNTFAIVHPDDETGLASYTTKIGYQFGLRGEYRCWEDLWAEVGVMYRQSGYQHILDSVEGETVTYDETMTYFDIPVSAKYYFLHKKIHPYIKAGINFLFINEATATTSRGTSGSSDYSSDLVSRTSYRTASMIGYSGGAGLSYRLKSFQFFAEISYSWFPTWVDKASTRFSDALNVWKYYYIDDDFNMNNMQVNVGSSYIITYKNKKAK